MTGLVLNGFSYVDFVSHKVFIVYCPDVPIKFLEVEILKKTDFLP